MFRSYQMHASVSQDNFKQFIALVLELWMKSFGKLFVRLFLVASLFFFATIVSLFGAGAAPFLTAPAPAPAPSKPLRRLRLRLRLRPKRVGSGGSGSGSGSASLVGNMKAKVGIHFTYAFINCGLCLQILSPVHLRSGHYSLVHVVTSHKKMFSQRNIKLTDLTWPYWLPVTNRHREVVNSCFK